MTEPNDHFRRQAYLEKAKQLNEDSMATERWTLATCFLANAGAASLVVGLDNVDPAFLKASVANFAVGIVLALLSGPVSSIGTGIVAAEYEHKATEADEFQHTWLRTVGLTIAAFIGVIALIGSAAFFAAGVLVFL